MIGQFPRFRVEPWGQVVRGSVAWEDSQARMSVRAFVTLWARVGEFRR